MCGPADLGSSSRLPAVPRFLRSLACTLLGITLFAGAAGAQAEVDENLARVLAGFGLQWGQSVAEVQKNASVTPRLLDRPLDYGKLMAPLVISNLPLQGSQFHVFFQFERKSGQLKQILVQRRRADGEQAAFEHLEASIKTQLGEPVETCRSPGHAVRRKAERWTTEQIGLRLVFFDYRAPGIITEGEPLTEDPTVPWYKRESLNVAALPVRLLLRITSPDDDDPSC